MTHHCDKVELFVDGELPAEEAAAFRLHLPDCVKCQLAMDRLMQLHFLAASHVQQSAEQEAPVAARPPVRQRRAFLSGLAALFEPQRRTFFLAAAALAAVLIVVVVRQPFQPSLQSDVWLAQRQDRLLEARISYRAADEHRRPAAKSMGGSGSAEELSYEDLGVLQKSDQHGLVAALLVRNDPRLAEQALQALEKMDRSPDLDSDRAVAMLLLGRREESLRLLDAVLAANPRHPQALWNRGLVLQELGLPLLAARAFFDVAALNEKGWSKEAKEKAENLQRQEFARRDRWKALSEAGDRLIGGAHAVQLPEGFSQFPSARRHFYEAVRTAPSREAVLALLPLAQELDAQAKGDVLASYVRRVAEADFSRRAPLAAAYARLLQGGQLSTEEQERLLTELLGSREDDILMGAIVAMDATPRHMAVFEAKAAASGDPWSQLLVAQLRASADARAGNWTRSIQTLVAARGLCQGGGVEYRCMMLDRELLRVYNLLQQLDRVRAQAEDGWKKANSHGEWLLESIMLWFLSEGARLAGDTSLTRAYAMEYLERDRDNPDTVRRVHQTLAVMELRELRSEAARSDIDAALATGSTLGLPGVLALADLSRLKPAPGDEASLMKHVEALKLTVSPGEKAIATHALGRLLIERDKARGRELLLRVIKEAEAPEFAGNSAARRARAYSFTSLILEAGQREAFQEALELFEQEHQGALPRRCLLAATASYERSLFLVRGGDGVLAGHYQGKRQQPLPQRLDGEVPPELLARLATCEQVEVLARPPLHGRVGLLPSKMAWSYLTRTSERRAPPQVPAIHLVVSDVEMPPDVPLKRLNAWKARFGPQEQPVTLSGAEAMPSRVLESMKNATEIDLVAHGILSDFSDASYLLLAPERGGSRPGSPELGISEVRAASLKGAPFVVLAACHAAHATYSVDEPLSLPAAFIEAGARGVLAATVEIPDLEAEDFFNAVRERMRLGTAPALALRDERLRWLSKGWGKTWLDSVLLFE
jgi:hypothetical protein